MNLSAETHSPAIPRCRKHQNSSMATVLRRKYGILVSPPFQWKHPKKRSAVSAYSSPVNFQQAFQKNELSARMLAAGLWRLRFMEVSGDGNAVVRDGSFHTSNSKSQLADGFPKHQNTRYKFRKAKDLQRRRPLTILRSRNGIRCEATKLDHDLPEVSNGITGIYGRKLVDDRKVRDDSVVSPPQAELLRVQRCINKLKAERKSSREQIEQLIEQKLEEDIIFWKRRERQKIQAMLDDLKDRLERERRRRSRSRERMELLNSKLVHELAEANLSAKKFMKYYEETQRGRELMEEVCNELAKQIREGKAKFEELLRESMKIHEEVEEERKMSQMAELWREDWVQMKLVEVKLALEGKCNQMTQLISYLQAFLRSSGAKIDTMDLREGELIKQAAEFQRLEELSDDFSKSDAISSIVRLDEYGLSKKSVLHYNTSLEVNNARETDSHVEDQDSTFPPLRRDTSVDSVNQEKNILGSEAGCSKNTGLGSANCKASSASKPRSCQSNGTTGTVAKTSLLKRPGNGGYRYQDPEAQQYSTDFMLDDCNRILSTDSIQSAQITSPCQDFGEYGSFKRRELVGQWNSTNTINPHITRGMKGCLEWPQGIPKTKMKAISFEARVRSQRSQLQEILKPKTQPFSVD